MQAKAFLLQRLAQVVLQAGAGGHLGLHLGFVKQNAARAGIFCLVQRQIDFAQQLHRRLVGRPAEHHDPNAHAAVLGGMGKGQRLL